MEFCCKFVDGRLDREQALRCAVATVGTGGHVVGVDDVVGEAERLGLGVERNRLVTGQADRGGAMLAVGTCVREGVHVDTLDDALFGGTEAEMNLHLVTGRGGRLALDAAEDNFGRLLRFPSDEGRIDQGDRGLFCAKSAADTRFCDAHHRLGDVQGVRDVTPGVEDDLGRAEDIQAAIQVDVAAGAEGLHHGLLAGFGVVNVVDDDVALAQHGVDIAGTALVVGAEVALVVGTDRAKALPVILGVNEDGVVLGGVVVEDGFQYLIFYFDEFQRLIDAFLVFTGDDGDHIAHKANVAVDDKAVIGAGFRVGLAGLREAAAILRHILPSENCFDARHFFSDRGVDGLDDGVRVGRAQQLDDEAVLGGEVVHIDGLAGDKLHGVLFPERFVDGVQLTHSAASLFFFHARNA